MSGEDWQAGDLALATSFGRPGEARCPAVAGHKKPRPGGVYTLEGTTRDQQGTLGLVLEGHHSDHPTRAWAAYCFRKIRPHLPDAEDAETIALLNGAPAKVLTRQLAEHNRANRAAIDAEWASYPAWPVKGMIG